MKQLIKKILIQEVNKKYSKPTPSVEKLIYNWLDNYISGAQMYHEKHYEFNYGFEWCNDGMEIMSFDLAFEYIDEFHSNKVKNSERNFDRGTLQIPKDIIQEMLTDIPVRKNYLIYVIEEWFEDTLLDEVSTMIGRDDISIDEFEEYPETSLVCVPPRHNRGLACRPSRCHACGRPQSCRAPAHRTTHVQTVQRTAGC